MPALPVPPCGPRRRSGPISTSTCWRRSRATRRAGCWTTWRKGSGADCLSRLRPTFVFTHALVREALASTLSSSRAAFCTGRRLARWRADPGADPLAVARHARLGGELSQASSLLVDAARVAVSRFHHAESLSLLDEAIALDDTAPARLERARVHSMLAHYDSATADLQVARELGAGAEALEVAAWSAHYQRRFDEALTFADRGAHEATDPEIRAS